MHRIGDRRDVRAVATVALAFAIMLVNNGCIIAGLTAFDAPILADLPFSFGSLKIRDTVTIASLGLTVPITGFLLDRIKVRPIIIAGLVSAAIGLIGYRYVRSPVQLYAMNVFMGMSQGLCGLISHVVLISRWTGRHRGLSLGIVVAGSSLGNALVPSFNGFLLHHMPWRDAVAFGGLISIAMIPLVLLVYRERPNTTSATLEPALGAGDAGRTEMTRQGTRRNFWLLGGTAATSVFSVLGLATNLALYVQTDLKFGAGSAENLLFALFFGSCVAQVIAGTAADRFGALQSHRIAIVVMAIGTFMIGFAPSGVLLASIVIFGVGWGANSAMLQIQPVALFAPRILGRTLGWLAVMETVGGSLAPTLVGYGKDLTGTYKASFAALSATMAISIVCVFFLSPRRSAATA